MNKTFVWPERQKTRTPLLENGLHVEILQLVDFVARTSKDTYTLLEKGLHVGILKQLH